MSLPTIEPTDATLGAVVTGIRLAALADGSAPDADAEWEALHAAFLEHALLIFSGQHLDSREQVALGRRLGEIEHLFGDSGAVPISNQRRDGTLLADEEPAMQIMRGNEGWHTDSSYMPVSARASLLSARVVPPSGGDTEWADMRAAWQALDDATRARIEGLSAFHSIRYSQARIGHTDDFAAGYGYGVAEPPLRPLVKVHPETGRPSLFIGRHAYGIPGLAPEASERLLDDLLRFACRPPRVHRHAWRPGDLAIWDNRCVLHRARPFDHAEARVMLHTRIAGDPATEGAAPEADPSSRVPVAG